MIPAPAVRHPVLVSEGANFPLRHADHAGLAADEREGCDVRGGRRQGPQDWECDDSHGNAGCVGSSLLRGACQSLEHTHSVFLYLFLTLCVAAAAAG